MRHPVRQLTITVSAPAELAGRHGRLMLADFYGALLGMEVVSTGWLQIAKARGSTLSLALDGDGWSDARPPRWQDPEHPQQMHLDVAVPDLAAAASRAAQLGATVLLEEPDHHVLADPAGHPFCLWADAAVPEAVVARVVFDCFSPRALASFYEGLLGVDTQDRIVDSPERVVIGLADDVPDFAFQHAVYVACRWPDPAYPAQLHVDYRFVDGTPAAVERVERLGGIRLPKLADTEIFADPAGHPFCL